ncbi:MAG: hypothetical protein ACK4NU_03345 [Brevundimonas sp.]
MGIAAALGFARTEGDTTKTAQLLHRSGDSGDPITNIELDHFVDGQVRHVANRHTDLDLAVWADLGRAQSQIGVVELSVAEPVAKGEQRRDRLVAISRGVTRQILGGGASGSSD